VNYRGSSGYGYKFIQAGFGHWGNTVQDDLADGVKWAVKQGYADPGRVCILGGGFGGYSAVMSAERFPGMYQCAVSYAGIYNLAALAKRPFDMPGMGVIARFLHGALGDDMKQLQASSPVNNVDKLKAPVFLIQGGHDFLARPAGYQQMVAAIKKHG